ncbi:helix-turn-helix domain-containing protein [Listeria valentina]
MVRMLKEGKSVKTIATENRISRPTIYRIKKELCL